LDDGSFEVTGSGDLAAADPTVSGNLRLTSLSPRALMAAAAEPLATADPNALASLSGTARWRLGSHSVGLDKLSLQLDQTRLTGSVRIQDFDRLATTVDLSLDRLDMDRYLPPGSDEEEADAEPGDALATEIPADLIRELDVTGTLAAGELKVLNLALRQVSASLSVRNGVLRLDPLTAALYGGQYRGVITIDATGASADLDLSQQISAVQIGDLLRDYVGSDQVSGALSMELTGTGLGNTLHDLLENLDGSFAARLNDGTYHGMDIQYEIQRARALLKKQPPPPAPERKDTEIRKLSVSGSLADGVLGSDDLSALLPGLRVSGKGGVNLINQSLDYRLLAEVLKGDAAASGNGLEDLVDVAIPLSIQGPLSSPSVGVDLKDLLTRSVRDTVEKKARSLLLEKLGGGKSAEPTQQQPAEAETPTQPSSATPAQPPADESESAEEVSPRDLLKRGLLDLLGPPPKEAN
jgi:AsmA protein